MDSLQEETKQSARTMTINVNDKISDLETLLAHQDRQIQELNEVVTSQWAEIESLKKYMQTTKSKMDELEHSVKSRGDSEFQSIADEAAANKPPHY